MADTHRLSEKRSNLSKISLGQPAQSSISSIPPSRLIVSDYTCASSYVDGEADKTRSRYL